MRWILLTLIAMALLAMRGHAQPKDVTESARQEISRRGNWVEQTGNIRGGLITAAMAPPADDSGKWYITLVGKQGEPDFEAMKSMVAANKDEALAGWIDASDSSRSFTHYHITLIDDATQAGWLSGLKPAIEKYGLPMFVVQPPRSGQFGAPSTIVKGIHGRHSAKDLAALFRDGVITYVRTLENPIQIGHRDDQRSSIGVPPPFNVPPQPQRQPEPVQIAPHAPVPSDWPPSTPAALTIEQIQVACPGATPEFVIAAISSKDTNPELVKLKWLIYQKDHPTTPAVPAEIVPVNPLPCPVSTPSQGYNSLVLGLTLGTIAALMMTGLGILIVRLVDARGARRDTIQQLSPRYANPRDNPEYFRTSNPDPIASTAAPSWRPPANNAGPPG